MAIVIDASATAAWCLADEASKAGDRLLERLAREGAVVPALWRWEIANMLIFAERNNRIDAATVAERLELLDQLPIAIDTEATMRGWSTTLAIARGEDLTAYDAAYLELAIRSGLPLATKDKLLARAARRREVELLDV
jgi:predicted nucleic acid-binding protein